MRRKRDGERGATLVEFALILPVFMALVLGTFTGGLLYNRKLQLTHAAREGARYGATVATDTAFVSGDWADNVRDLVFERAAGDVSDTDDICVALVEGSPAAVVNGSANFTTNGTSPCFSEAGSDTGKRVQVRAEREGKLEALFFTMNVTLSSQATAKFEEDEG